MKGCYFMATRWDFFSSLGGLGPLKMVQDKESRKRGLKFCGKGGDLVSKAV